MSKTGLCYSKYDKLHPIKMENLKDIRWQQRFENLLRAFAQLESAVKQVETANDLEKEGLIQRFEYTFELAWKTAKDYLESKSIDVKFSSDIIKEAFKYEMIEDGELWMKMLESRNKLAHTYNEENFKSGVALIVNDFYPGIKQFIAYLQSKK